MAVAREAPRGVLGSKRIAPPRRFLATLSDERLAERLRRGDERAFELLYDRHHRPLLGFCRHMLRSHEEAEDATQQVFLSAHRALTGNGDPPAGVKPWLYAIARNRCVSMMRSRKGDARPLEDDDGTRSPSPAEKAEQQADLAAIVSDVRSLPEAQRTALVLTELGDLSHAEVAEVLECEPSKVRALVFQGRAALVQRREAREAPCHEVREEIANLAGSRLRGRVRRHSKSCTPCATFADEVRRQRQLLALALPVAPSLGLKRSVLTATTGAGGGGGAAGGGLVAGAAVKAGGVGGAGGAGGVAASGGAAAGTGVVAAITAHAGATTAAAVALAAGSVATGATVGDKQTETARSPARTATEEGRAPAAPPPAAKTRNDSESGARPTKEENDPTKREEKAEPEHGPPADRGSPPEHAASDQSNGSPPAHAASAQHRPATATRTGPSSANASAEARGNGGRDSSASQSRGPDSRTASDQAAPVRQARERPNAPSGNQRGIPSSPSGKQAGVTVDRPSVPKKPVGSAKDTATGKLGKASPVP